jgi:hypothetical protein
MLVVTIAAVALALALAAAIAVGFLVSAWWLRPNR